MELKTSSSFKTTGLLQLWQTLCKIFSKCLTARVTGSNMGRALLYDIMDANKKVDLEHVQCPPESKILTNIIKNHPLRFSIAASSSVPWIYMAQFWHTLKEDGSKYRLTFMLDKKEMSLTLDGFRTVFHLPQANANNHDKLYASTLFLGHGRYKDKVGMKIPDWIISEEMKHTEHYRMNDESKIHDTRLEPRSDKESPEVEITNDEEVEITNVVIPVNVNEEEEEITDEVSLRIHTDLVSLDTEKLQELTDDPHDDAHPEGENRAKRQKTYEYEAYVSRESSSGQVNKNEQGPSTLGNQEQEDDYDFWTESYASDDDEILTKQMSQDIIEEVSLTIDEAKLKKMVDEMLRQRCTSRDKHQYHIDQMKNFLKSDIFPAIIFNDDDIEEQTSRWVNKCVKKFNPYARYGVEHWKNPHAKIFYIRKQKEPGKPKEPDYKNLNKNDIEDIYLLIMNDKVPDYAETRLLWSLSVFIRSSVI
ncbi:hypothetical protein Tco_0268689 [Tanacetum coccineum]